MNIPSSSQQSIIAQSFSQAAPTYTEGALLQREVGQRLLSQLESLPSGFARVLDVGTGTGYLASALVKKYPEASVCGCDMASGMVSYAKQSFQPPCAAVPAFVCARAERLPFADRSMSLIVSSLMLQWCADLEAVFREFHRVLKPGGALFFSTLGPTTLHELHASWKSIYPEASLHTFTDMHDIGDILSVAKFLGVVMSQETIVLKYKRARDLLRDLRAIGANRPASKENNRGWGAIGKQRFERFIHYYEKYRGADGLLPASYNVVYGHAIA